VRSATSTYHRLVHRLLPGVEFHQNRYARAVGDVLASGGWWLDLGAGRRLHGGWIGVTQDELAKRAAAVIGCDVSPTRLHANRFLTGAAIADGMYLPFGEGRFDLVTANMVLEHLQQPSSVFSEIRRVLKPGGRFIFVTPNVGHPVVRVLSLLVPRTTRSGIALTLEGRRPGEVFPTFYRANSVAWIRGAATLAGLIPVQIELFNSFPMIRRFAPLTWVECWWIRLSQTTPFRRFRSNIVGCLQRPDEA
jgi:SAM-dependent methyltransferase